MPSSRALFRSVLYIPASHARAMNKARGLECDAIIFDLEDAVAPGEKVTARETLATELKVGGYGFRNRIVRINSLESDWGVDDARAVAEMDCDAVLLPKVESPEMLDRLTEILGTKPLWAMMETPRGVLNALQISDHRSVEGFVLGTNDLSHELGCATGGDRMAMRMSLQTCLAAARSAGIICVDGVYNAFRDEEGLLAECEQGHALGMDGKTLIHPSQIPPANRIFAPTPDQINLATRQIAAFDDATARGEGVAVLDGRIVENLHVETAMAVLAKAEAIVEREAA
jgi:(3S)-malyl-CoA thioesterase